MYYATYMCIHMCKYILGLVHGVPMPHDPNSNIRRLSRYAASKRFSNKTNLSSMMAGGSAQDGDTPASLGDCLHVVLLTYMDLLIYFNLLKYIDLLMYMDLLTYMPLKSFQWIHINVAPGDFVTFP